MCGIVGVIEREVPIGTHRNRVLQMMSTIRHRGPDGDGLIEFDKGVTFGHVRLAILDLNKSADQPMKSTTGRSVIIFNGELYNYQDLRKILQSKGFTFRTHSDTEVILNAYECWGLDAIPKFNGMFAFALHDALDNSILLVRDRLGIKPLYYCLNNNRVLFGSEIKAIRAGLDIRPGLDPSALAEYLAFQNNYSERTLVEGVFLFPAASYAVIKQGRLVIEPIRYWEARIAPECRSMDENIEQLSAMLDESVRDQIQADVPVNSFLSGGIDSGAIASVLARKVGRIKTFTCGFDLSGVTDSEQLFDERSRAECVSTAIGSEHYEVVLKEEDFLSRMSVWAWHAEEPRVGSSFPNFCISDLASRFAKVCLSGTGADELFGGYPWRYHAAQTANSDDEFIANYENFWTRMLPCETYHALLEPLNQQILFDPQAVFRDKITSALARSSDSTYRRADAALIFEIETFLHGLLVVEDKASMAHGLEVRVPLIDNRLIDLALALPFNAKVDVSKSLMSRNVYGKGSTEMPEFTNGKKILRQVFAQYVPYDIVNARKQGFSPPVETWFRRRMQPWLSDEVFSHRSPLAEYLDMRVAQQLWGEHISCRANHRLFIWGMIALHLFVTDFLRK